MIEWAEEEIRLNHLYWPKFGSFDHWICQVLNLYVNGKKTFDQEESDCAALWKGSSVAMVLHPLKRKKRKIGKTMGTFG